MLKDVNIEYTDKQADLEYLRQKLPNIKIIQTWSKQEILNENHVYIHTQSVERFKFLSMFTHKTRSCAHPSTTHLLFKPSP